jgi:hypothetical protein
MRPPDFRIVRPKRQAPEARARLESFCKYFERRQGELDKNAEKFREEQDEAIRAAYKDDLPMAAIAEGLGMSHQRVSQTVRSYAPARLCRLEVATTGLPIGVAGEQCPW